MPNLTAPLTVTGAVVAASQAAGAQLYKAGTLGMDRVGRFYRYCLNGGVALVPGDVIQCAAQVANHINGGVTATAVGATSIAVTPGATAGAANLYADGVVVVSTTPGGGYSYIIDRHAAITASTEFTLYLAQDDPIQVALTTSSKVDLRHHPYKHVIQAPVTTLTGAVVGVAVYPIPIAEWGWLGVQGVFPVLIDVTPGVGFIVSSPAAVAGGAAINSSTLPFVGTILSTGVDTKWKHVLVQIG